MKSKEFKELTGYLSRRYKLDVFPGSNERYGSSHIVMLSVVKFLEDLAYGEIDIPSPLKNENTPQLYKALNQYARQNFDVTLPIDKLLPNFEVDLLYLGMNLFGSGVYDPNELKKAPSDKPYTVCALCVMQGLTKGHISFDFRIKGNINKIARLNRTSIKHIRLVDQRK
tara:strand:+ start:593 stop:1099 length:507 start_codon:yes stop_codon:yes gene_type:complete